MEDTGSRRGADGLKPRLGEMKRKRIAEGKGSAVSLKDGEAEVVGVIF